MKKKHDQEKNKIISGYRTDMTYIFRCSLGEYVRKKSYSEYDKPNKEVQIQTSYDQLT